MNYAIPLFIMNLSLSQTNMNKEQNEVVLLTKETNNTKPYRNKIIS